MGQKQAVTTQAESRLALLSQRLRNKPFWIWSSIEKHKQEYKRTNGDCCFNHIIGLPQKDGVSKPMFDYEQIIHNCLIANNNVINNQKCLWIKKATGLGVTEFFLRFMVWLCLKDSRLSGTQMIIVTGPNIDISIKLVKRMKELFQNHLITFGSKETVIELNGCHIESYPSHHLDAARGLPNVSFILLDEADFFPV
jgi:hypothetical protein